MRLENLKKDVEEGYKVLPNIDRERYTEMPGLEGPFQTSSGKPIYYDPKEGAYYDRDTDMYLTYDEFKKLDEGRLGFSDIAKFGRENASKIDMEARRRGSADMEPGEADQLRYKIAKEMGLVEADKTAIDAAVQQALDSDMPKPMPRPKARPTKVPRPKPRPAGIRIGGMPDGSTRGIDPKDNYSPEDLKRLLMQSAMERMETEGKSLASLRNRSSFDAQNRLKDKNKLPTPKVVKPAQMDLFDNEAGDHDRMYKVVHVKKGVMDIKAKTSYEAAKKFAKEKGLKSTAGVDVHLYPLEEGSMSDLHARIMSSDDPHGEIYKMLTGNSPEAQYIQSMYNDTSSEYGLHPDDDFEDIIDRMVDEMEGNMPFEGKNKMGPQDIKPGDRVEHEGDMYEVVDVSHDPDAPGTIIADNLETGLRNRLPVADVTKLFGMDAMTDQDKEEAEAMFKRLKKAGSGSLKHVATEDVYNKDTVKKNALEALVDIAKTSKKYKGGVTDEQIEILGGLIQDMDIAGIEPEKYSAVNELFKVMATDKKADMTMIQPAYAQVKTIDEGHSPHKKGTKKYKAHMAAMHANSVDLNSMRNALKLDESTDANTVVAQYTRTTLDPSYKSWDQVKEQVNYIKSFVKESDTVNTNRVMHMLSKINLQEKTDKKIMIKEDIDKLRQIVQDKSAMSIKFSDGTMKVDMTTANIFLQAYDRMKERNQMKIQDMMQTKAGFLRVLDFIYGAMK